MIGWLLLIGLFGGGGYWAYRAWQNWQERYGNRNDDYENGQLAIMLHARDDGSTPAAPPPAAAPLAPRPPAAVAPQPAAAASLSAAIPPGQVRHLPLDAAAQSVYLHLHVDIPQLPVLSCVDIACLLPPETRHTPRLLADFVICKKDFSPAVVIFIERGGEAVALDHAHQLLRAQRLRVLRWHANALPAREQMRQQIFKPKAG